MFYDEEIENEYEDEIVDVPLDVDVNVDKDKDTSIASVSVVEIPWPRSKSRSFFTPEPENLIILTKYKLNPYDIKEIKLGKHNVYRNRVYKNNSNSYNSKYIIKAFLNSPVDAIIKIKEDIAGEIETGGEQPGESDIELEYGKNIRLRTSSLTDKSLESLKMRREEYVDMISSDIDIEEGGEFDYDNYLISRKKGTPIPYRDQMLLLQLRNMCLINSRRLDYDRTLLKTFRESMYDEKLEIDEELQEIEFENEESNFKEELENEEINEIEEYLSDTQIEAKPSKLVQKLRQVREEFLIPYKDDDQLDIKSDYFAMQNDKLAENRIEFPLARTEYMTGFGLNGLARTVKMLYDDDTVSLYEIRPQFNKFEPLMDSSNFNALKNYNLPIKVTDDKGLTLLEYKTLLAQLQGPSQKFYKAATFSSKSGINPDIGLVQKGKIKNVSPEDAEIKIIFKDGGILGDYELYEMTLDGKIMPDADEETKIALELMQAKDIKNYEKKAFSTQSLPICMQDIEEEKPKEDFKQKLHDIVTLSVNRELKMTNSVTLPENIYQILSTGDIIQDCYTLGESNNECKYFMLRTCATVIFDISRSRKEIPDTWYYLKQYLELENRKELSQNSPDPTRHLVLITNFLSWSKSDKKVLKNISESTFLERKCHPDYTDYYNLENFVFKIGSNPKFNIKTTIIYSGIPYGHEEDVFVYLFKLGWENEPQVPIWSSGDNILPIIHIDDLSKIVLDTVNQHLYPTMVFAISPNYQSLMTIAKAIVTNLGNGKVKKSVNYETMCIPKIIYDLMQLNIRYSNVNFDKSQPKYLTPFENFTMEIIQELKTARKLRNINIVLLGPPNRIKFEIGLMLSEIYDVPMYHSNNILKKYLKLLNQTRKRNAVSEVMGEDLEEEVSEKLHDDPEIQALKKVIENKTKDGNRQWLAQCLNKLLRTPYVRNHGYILIDFPVRIEDTEYIFRSENEEMGEDMPINNLGQVKLPEFVFLIEATDKYAYGNHMFFPNYDIKSLKELRRDLDEYIYYRNTNRSIHNFFEFKNYRYYPFDVEDGPEILDRMIQIIGFPNTDKGLTEYSAYLKYIKNYEKSEDLAIERRKLEKSLEKAEKELIFKNIGNPEEKLFSIREQLQPMTLLWAKNRLSNLTNGKVSNDDDDVEKSILNKVSLIASK